MATCAGTIRSMGRKKKNPQSRAPNYALFARLPPGLGAAFDRYLESQRPKPTANSAVVVAMEEFLQKRGFWPPPSDQPPAGA